MFSVRSHARWAVPFALALTALGTTAPIASASKQVAPVRDDFNGDGYADLAVGAPLGTVDGKSKAGYVTVMYGGPHGISTSRRTVISRATAGIPGSPVKGQEFGLQLSKGDLDGDGYADLVVGDVSVSAKAVVVWGGPHGLSGGTSVPATNTQTGDFDGDGRLDLALFTAAFSPGDDPLGTEAVLWKGPLKRTGTPAATSGMDPDLQYVDVHDGATGDVNGDGRADLALSEYCGDGVHCTQLYLSTPAGLTRVTDAPDGAGTVAFGDLNGDGYDDMVTGDHENEQVQVAYGSATGLGARGTWRTYSQNTPGVPGATEEGDQFGRSVAVGDITGDGIDDVAVGVPGENQSEGLVDVLRGSRGGLTGTGAQGFTQNTAGVPGSAEINDVFGATVQLLDINGNGHADLSAAAPNEDGGNGAVWELRGGATGLTTDAALVFGPKSVGAPYAKAAFGAELK
ncbi:VCBS repeat-containing protein [Streptomyces sp. NPDC001843]|uniref:VCBS repeat-containing protein n=1 Tax=Streptomyces sp. NPDC001843 TaxID=3364617 RepID=UPI00367B24BD